MSDGITDSSKAMIPDDEGTSITPDNKYAHEGISLLFGLTYANYLVVNRLLLESMSDEWQEKFCLLMDELHEELGWAQDLQNGFHVEMFSRDPQIKRGTETCPSCDGSGTDTDSRLEDEVCEECDGDGEIEVEGDGYETFDEIGPGRDPVPHYRHSSKLPLSSMDPDEVNRQYFSLKEEWLKTNHVELWRKHFGPEFEDGEEVEILHHPSHARPPILGDMPGTLGGKIVEAIDHCLYWVDVKVGSETFKVQLHADQIRKINGD